MILLLPLRKWEIGLELEKILLTLITLIVNQQPKQVNALLHNPPPTGEMYTFYCNILVTSWSQCSNAKIYTVTNHWICLLVQVWVFSSMWEHTLWILGSTPPLTCYSSCTWNLASTLILAIGRMLVAIDSICLSTSNVKKFITISEPSRCSAKTSRSEGTSAFSSEASL